MRPIDSAEQRPTSPASEYASWQRRTAITGLLLLAITLVVSRLRIGYFPLYQVQSQDLLPLIVLSISLLMVTVWTPSWQLPARLPKAQGLLALGVVMAGLLAYGSYALMGNFPLSIDERMVVFDMAVFDGGHLATPLAPEWRAYANALFPAPLLNQNMPAAVVSAYLPMNALLRLAFSKLADPALFNPLLALAGGAALLDISRRTFGRDDPACWVVMFVYVLSAQMLATTMTVYSMTGHMALNLIWLAAFLRGGRLGHSIAIITGSAATGFHQLAFHPFFVAPFLLWQLGRGEQKLVTLYGAAYAAIILWWIYYPVLISHQVVSGLEQPPDSDIVSRIATAFAMRGGATIFTTFLNLLRFTAWQNLALLPLLTAAIVVAVRDRGFPAALLLGIALWMAFITMLIPFQGHGWGYRYLHGYLGSFALLAGYGYQELRAVMDRKADGLVLALSAATAVVTIPLSFAAAQRFVGQYVGLESLVARQRTPMVLIDTDRAPAMDGHWAGNALENVYNAPDLDNRPLRLSSRGMNPPQLAGLCQRGRIALITRADQRRAGFAFITELDSPTFARLVYSVERKMPDCFVSSAGLKAAHG